MNLAIKGHYTRGEEVIKILEMLGGRNVSNLDGNATYYYYTIENDKEIIEAAFYIKAINDKFYILSLEEFLEKFPYKVGDKVYNIIHNENQTITDLAWDSKENEVVYQTNNNEYVFVNYIQPYKEETMDGKYNVEKYLQVWDAAEKGLEVFVNDNFELKEDNGKFYIVKKQPQYPKTYEECCKVLGYSGNYNMILTTDVDKKLFNALYRLKVCRDAYWRIAGEQMGLGKPWKPELNSKKQKFALSNVGGNISFEVYGEYNSILCFPTEEMREVFFENFKELIEIAKELL